MSNTRTYLLYAVVVLIWGTTWAAIPFQLGVVAEEYSVAYRFLLGSLCLFLYAAIAGKPLRIAREHYPMVIITGSLMFSVNYLFTYYGSNYVTSGLVAVLFSLMAICNAFFERLFFGRALEKRLLIASLFGVAGIVLLFLPEVERLSLADDTLLGIVLIVIAVLFAGLANMGAVVNSGRQLPIIATNAHGMAWGALTSLVVGLLLGKELSFSLQADYLLSLAYLSVFGSAVVFGCYLALLKTIGSARAGYTSVLFPVVALLVSTIAEDYQWSTFAIAGLAMIIVGNWLALTRIIRT